MFELGKTLSFSILVTYSTTGLRKLTQYNLPACSDALGRVKIIIFLEEARLLNKCSCLALALGLTKITNIRDVFCNTLLCYLSWN